MTSLRPLPGPDTPLKLHATYVRSSKTCGPGLARSCLLALALTKCTLSPLDEVPERPVGLS